MVTGSPSRQHKRFNVSRHVSTFLRWIIEPPAGVEEKQRRPVRLLSTFLLFITVNTLIGMAVMKNTNNTLWVVMLGTATILMIGYGVSRTTGHRLATLIAITMPAVPIIAMILFSPYRDDIPIQLLWLALPLLVCSLLLPLRHTIITAICYVLLIALLIPFINLPIARIAESMAFMFVIIFFVVAVTATRQREQSEIEHQLAERQQAEKKQRTIINSALDGFWVCNLKGEFLEVNESYCKMTGYTREELLKMSILDIEAVENHEQTAQRIKKIVEQGSDRFETQHKRKDGKKIDLEISVNYLNIGEGQMFVFIRDITERKRAEEALRESEERFSKAFRSSPNVISILSLEDDRHVEINESFTRFTGYSREEVIGHSPKELDLWVKPTEKDRMMDNLEKEGRAYNHEFGSRHKSGEIRFGLGSAEVIKIGGKPHRIVVITDITERKKAEDNLKQALVNLEKSNVQLAATNKELEAFSYSVSHDLRSPLRSIDGFSQALLEDYSDKLDENGQDYLKRLRSASQKMGQLIDGLLKLSRLTRAEMREEPVDLSTLAEDIIARLQEEKPLKRRSKFIIDKGLTAQGDPELLRVLLENLLGNAWKFTSKNRHAIIEFGATQNNGKKTFFVKDNGSGFDMTYADKLFGAFQRLHDGTEYPGTGIGLATVQRIINRHGGTIQAEAAVGKGATFYFTLD